MFSRSEQEGKEMTPQEQKIVSKWSDTIEGKPSLTLLLNQTAQSGQIQSFCDELIHFAPAIHVKTESGEDPSFPEIRVGQNIHYRAVPLENELEPFLEALSSLDSPQNKFSESIQDSLAPIQVPALIKVYVSPQCPFCPKTVRDCIALAQASSLIDLVVIDGMLFPNLTIKDTIRSVPTVILDDQFQWTGSIQISDLINMIVNRDPAMLRAESFIQMIQDGRAADLAQMMVDKGHVFPAFLEVLAHEKWPIRLGAMVAFEYLVEKDRALSSQIVHFLQGRFPQMNDPIKGDVLYLLGESRDETVIPMLQSVIQGDVSPELKEAAQEALATLEKGIKGEA
jgi:hypothetical protein